MRRRTAADAAHRTRDDRCDPRHWGARRSRSVSAAPALVLVQRHKREPRRASAGAWFDLRIELRRTSTAIAVRAPPSVDDGLRAHDGLRVLIDDDTLEPVLLALTHADDQEQRDDDEPHDEAPPEADGPVAEPESEPQAHRHADAP